MRVMEERTEKRGRAILPYPAFVYTLLSYRNCTLCRYSLITSRIPVKVLRSSMYSLLTLRLLIDENMQELLMYLINEAIFLSFNCVHEEVAIGILLDL